MPILNRIADTLVAAVDKYIVDIPEISEERKHQISHNLKEHIKYTIDKLVEAAPDEVNIVMEPKDETA